MVCYYPRQAFWSAEIGRNGRRGITFNRGASFSGQPFPVSCKQCVGCRLERVKIWAMRCMHEKRMFFKEPSAFVTLTYAPEFLPPDGGLVKSDLQLFMKRVRNGTGPGVRFYGCGEYGGQFGRPHYHVLLFNRGFDDGKIYSHGKREEDVLYTSKVLSDFWSFGSGPNKGRSIGMATFGSVTMESCKYVAGYVMDKITGEKADDWYMGRSPEFALFSQGIGASYYKKYAHEIYARDEIIVDGQAVKPPRYYDDKWKMLDPMGLDELKTLRRRMARKRKFHVDNTPDRRRVREVVELKRLAFKRGM